MILGVLLACVSVCSYTVFGILAQYFDLNPVDLILGRACVQITVVSMAMLWKRDVLELSVSTVLAGILLFFCTSGFIVVVHILPLGPAFILTHSNAGFTAIFARLLAKEKISYLKGVCILTILVGQILVAQPSFMFGNFLTTSSLNLIEYLGIMIGFLCSCSSGLLVVLVALNETPKRPMFLFGGFLSLASFLMIGPLIQESQIFHGPATNTWIILLKALFVGIFALLSIGAYCLAIGLCPSVLLALIGTAECVTSFIAQIVIFKQDVNVIHVCGVVIVMVSLSTAIYIDSQEKQKLEGYESLETKSKPVLCKSSK